MGTLATTKFGGPQHQTSIAISRGPSELLMVKTRCVVKMICQAPQGVTNNRQILVICELWMTVSCEDTVEFKSNRHPSVTVTHLTSENFFSSPHSGSRDMVKISSGMAVESHILTMIGVKIIAAVRHWSKN